MFAAARMMSSASRAAALRGGKSCGCRRRGVKGVSAVTAAAPFSTARHPSAQKAAVESPDSSTSESPSPLDDPPPLIFVRRHGCIVDMAAVAAPQSSSSASSEIRGRVREVQEAVAATQTLEELAERLRGIRDSSPSSTIPASSSTSIGSDSFVDADIVRRSRMGSADELSLTSEDLATWTDTKLDVRKLPGYYLMLSKSRLTLLVCATAAAGYGLASSPPFDPVTFALTVAGTGLLSSAANSINQYLEVPFDSQMNRTKNRVLVRGLVSPLHAVSFAAVSGAAGIYLLATQVNTTAAAIGALNLILYTCVYTPMKRASILNTWVGSVVGALPPLIGWAGASGGTLDPAAFVLAGVLYSWQFPHFNSLSWNLRPDYSRAGYRMMSVTHPALCRRVALRHAVLCQVLCVAAPALDLTETYFALEALPVNGVLVYLAWDFHRRADSSSSRKLFRYSLIHLPLLMTLMFVSKKKRKKKTEDE